MRALIYVMTPILILTFIFASRFVTWEKLKGEDSEAFKHLTSGIRLLKNDRRHKAITEFTRAILIDPNYAEAYIKRGFTYFQLERYKEAISDFTHTLSLDRYIADAYSSRGDVYHALEDLAKAVDDYTSSLTERRTLQVMSKRAKCYIEIGRIDEGIDDYSYIINHLPTPTAYYNRGTAYFEKYLSYGNTKEIAKLALADIEKAIEMQPLYALAYISRGEIHSYLHDKNTEQSDYSHATDLLTDAIENWQNDPTLQIPILLWRAVTYKKQNLIEKAHNDTMKTYELYAQFYLKNVRISDIL